MENREIDIVQFLTQKTICGVTIGSLSQDLMELGSPNYSEETSTGHLEYHYNGIIIRTKEDRVSQIIINIMDSIRCYYIKESICEINSISKTSKVSDFLYLLNCVKLKWIPDFKYMSDDYLKIVIENGLICFLYLYSDQIERIILGGFE